MAVMNFEEELEDEMEVEEKLDQNGEGEEGDRSQEFRTEARCTNHYTTELSDRYGASKHYRSHARADQ